MEIKNEGDKNQEQNVTLAANVLKNECLR